MTCIALGIAVTAVLVYRFGWLWIGLPIAACLGVAVASVVIHHKREKRLFRSLAVPLYGLYHMRSVEESSTGGYPYDIVPDFYSRYNKGEQDRIVGAMRRALSDPDIDLTRALPNLPFDDDQIRAHLWETLTRLGKQE